MTYPCSELRKGGTGSESEQFPSATIRDDGAHIMADDGVAIKRGYVHGVDDDKMRIGDGREISSTTSYWLTSLSSPSSFFSSRKVGKEGSLRSQLSESWGG